MTTVPPMEKYCKDCRFFIPYKYRDRLDLSECNHPNTALAKKRDPITGKLIIIESMTRYCSHLRDHTEWHTGKGTKETCGPEGKWWELPYYNPPPLTRKERIIQSMHNFLRRFKRNVKLLNTVFTIGLILTLTGCTTVKWFPGPSEDQKEDEPVPIILLANK